jgi:hypothetical protein
LSVLTVFTKFNNTITYLEVGARNERYLSAIYYNKTPGFEIIHGLLDRILHVLEIAFSANKKGVGYFIRAANGLTISFHLFLRLIIRYVFFKQIRAFCRAVALKLWSTIKWWELWVSFTRK